MRRHRKTAPCPECCPSGGGIFYAESHWNDETKGFTEVWRCQNCGHEMPRRSSPARKERQTPMQTTIAAALKRSVVEHQSLGQPEKHEFKNWDEKYDPQCGLLFITSDYGRIGDEGTMASILCRDHRHWAVGRKGKIQLLNAKGTKGGEFRTMRGVAEACYTLTK